MSHQDLIAAVTRAISDLASDTSVDASETHDDLVSIREDLDIRIEALESEMQ